MFQLTKLIDKARDPQIILDRRSKAHPSKFIFFSGIWWVVYDDLLKRVHPQGPADKLPRYAAIALARARRQIKKEENRELRVEILTETGGFCVYCDKHAAKVELTIEHLTPVSRGGKDVYPNLVAACAPCNNKRGNAKKPLRWVHPAWKGFVGWKLKGCKQQAGFTRGNIKKWKS